MNVNGFTHMPTRTRTVRLFPLVLTGALLFGMQPLQAAAIKNLGLTPSEAPTFAAWTNFLAGGPQTWATTPAPTFTPAVDSAIWQVLNTDTAAQAISNPMIEYLEWRRNLDPTRFDANHPNLSPALEQLLSSPSLPSNPPPPTSTPVQTPTLAQTVSPPTVPEPNSLLLAAAMTGWGIWWRRRIALRTSR
jgi:PEP-CTERM motif